MAESGQLMRGFHRLSNSIRIESLDRSRDSGHLTKDAVDIVLISFTISSFDFQGEYNIGSAIPCNDESQAHELNRHGILSLSFAPSERSDFSSTGPWRCGNSMEMENRKAPVDCSWWTVKPETLPW
jgi:hypothetical protein